jgi:uncharacterized repeat protein (TIGR01451 family)/gliding motility-associated-like protein
MLMDFTKVHSKTSNNLEVLNSSKVFELTCNQAVGLSKGLEFTPQSSGPKEHYDVHDKQNLTSGSYEHLLSVTEQVSPTSTLFTFTEPIEKYTQVNSHMQNPKGMGFKYLQKPLIKCLASTLFLLMSFFTTFGQLPTVDLKLSKSIDNSQPQVGALVIFTMVLQNEGSTDATQVIVEDMFPNTGLDYSSGVAESGTWTYNSTTGIGSWVIPVLAAGESVKLEIRATVKTEAMGVFYNVAEVKSLNEEDYDSVPNNKKLYEDDIATACFSVPIRWKVGDEYNVSIPPMYEDVANVKWLRDGVAVTSNTSQASVEADGSLSIVGPGSYTFTADLSSCNATGCCALQVVDSTGFDLALRKTTVATSVTSGQNVTFDIKVFNQGNVNATNVMVVDYIPTGFTLNDPNWNLIGGIAKLKNPIASILAGENKTVKIILKVDNGLMNGVRLDNFAEISDARGPNGTVVPDKDSTPDDLSNNDGVAKNDEIFEDGKQGGDEDDHDIASVTVTACYTITSITASDGNICVGESSMVKAISSDGSGIKWYLTPTGGTPLFTTGSNEEYKVEPTTNIVYYAELSTLSGSDCPNVRLPLAVQVNARPLNPTCSESVDICIDEKINLNDYIINAVTTPGGTFEWRTGPLVTSPLVANPTSVGPGKYYLFEKSGAGCFSNPSILNVKGKACDKFIDVTLRKTANKRLVARNDVVTYTVEVKNESPGAETAATNVRVEDALPVGLAFVSSTNFINNSGVLVATIPIIAINQTVLLTYEALVTGSGQIVNFAQVTAADQKDIDSSPSNGPLVNEDDDDDEVITVESTDPQIDLSLQKVVSNSSPKLNDNLTYTIRVKNDGPDEATNVDITDVMPSSLQYVTTTGGDAVTQTGGTVKVTFNKIAAGQTVQFVVVAKVIANGLISNTAEVTKADQKDKDSTPGNGIETEDDFGKVIVQVQDEVCTVATPLIACANPYICAGESTSISAIGCNGTIVWSTGATGNLITVTPSVTTTYTAQCKVGICLSPASNPVTVVVNSVAPPLLSATETTICAGSTSILIATGCTGSIMWSNGMVGGSIQVSPSTTTSYTAMCKVVNCESTNSQPITITVGSNTIAPTISSNLNTVCTGQSAILTAAGCSGILTWSTGATGSSITVTPNATQVYTVVCKVGSCSSPVSGPLTITVTPKQTPIITASKDATCGGEAVTLTAANCTGTVTWSTGATGSSITVMPAATTTYTATCGTGICAGTASKTITVGSGGTAPTITTSANSVCAGSAVTLTAAGCTGGAISWNTGATGNTLMVSPTTTTIYTATCTIGTACVGTKAITINVKPKPNPPVVTCGKERICAGEELVFTGHNCDGIVTWSTGATGKTMTVNPVVTTNYTATCTVDGCVSLPSTPITITVIKETPTITASEETVCVGGSTVLTAANCSGTYTWSTGSNAVSITVSPVATTTYSVTCTVEGCTGMAEKTITVTPNQTPIITASKDAICGGEAVTLTAAGCTGGAISWSTGTTGNSIMVTPVATTTYTATCGTGICAGTKTITITVKPKPNPPVVTCGKERICAGEELIFTGHNCDGIVTWSTGVTGKTMTVNPMVTTTYTATCTVDGCVSLPSIPVTITVIKETPTITASKETVCAGGSTVLTAANCSGTYTWSTGSNAVLITVSPAATTTYSVTCTVEGCTGIAEKTITVGTTQAQIPTTTANKTQLCEAGNVILTAANCAGTVMWSTGQTGASITVNVTATTSYTAVCKVGTCESPSSIPLTITVGKAAAPVIMASGTTVCSGSSVTMTATGCAGSVIWSNGLTGNSVTVSPVAKTLYTAVCQVGTNNCTSEKSNEITINVISQPNAPVISCSATRICAGDSITLAAIGCDGIVTWSTGATGRTILIRPTVTTVYTATCKIGSCISPASAAATINVGNPVSPQIVCKNLQICSGSSTIIEARGCDGIVQWSDGQLGSVITVSPTKMTSYSAICEGGLCRSGDSNVLTVSVSGSAAKPTIKDLVNVCPNVTVDLTTGVTSTPSAGGSFIFRTGNASASPTVSDPSKVTTGTYYVFESTGTCVSAGTAINVVISDCNTTIDCTTEPAMASAGKDSTICLSGDFYIVAGSIGGAAKNSTWTTSGTGTFENSLSTTTKYFYSLADINAGFVALRITTNDPDGAGSCVAASSSMTLTINAVKTKPTIETSKSPNICFGDSVILTTKETGAFTYKWSTGATTQSIKVKSSGSYTVKLVSTSGCCSVSSVAVDVNVGPSIPTPIVTSVASNTCPATSANLATAVTGTPTSSGGKFQFHTGPTITSPILGNVSAVPAGGYYVFEKSDLGCISAPAAIKVLIDSCGATGEGNVDIAVDINGSRTEIKIGDQITYTITVENKGPGAATNVKFTNTTSNGLEFVSGANGLTSVGNTYTATIPTLAVGEKKTYTYIVRVTKAGKLPNEVEVTGLNQVDPITSNNYDKYEVECKICQETCVAMALLADTTKQVNGSYNITFTSLVENCGNVELTAVDATHDLTEMFTQMGAATQSAISLVKQVSVGAGSQLIPNAGFDGKNDLTLLSKLGSKLGVGKTDTIRYTINVAPNGNIGPFSSNATVKAQGLTMFNILQDVSDVSNDGNSVAKVDATPTTVKLFNSPSISLALAITDTLKVDVDCYDVTLKAVVKNSGSLVLTNVIIKDELSKSFTTPATFSLVGQPSLSTGSQLVVNTAFNGNSEPNLTTAASTLAIGKVDTVTFKLKVCPAAVTRFENQASAQGTGMLADGTTETPVDLSNSGLNPDTPGQTPTELIIGSNDGNSIQVPCIGLALFVDKVEIQADSSYNITYKSLIRNCGNLNLNKIALCDALINTFGSPTVSRIVGKVRVNAGSSLVPDSTFDGKSKVCLLDSTTSSIAPNKEDTVTWTVNVIPNGFFGPFKNNVTVTSKSPSGQAVTDVSNDGLNSLPAGNTPTIVDLTNINNPVIGIAKSVKSITKVDSVANRFDVVFEFIVKNFGLNNLTNIQIQDNLAAVFGDSVSIDSVKVTAGNGLTANAAYTGKGDLINLLVGSTSTLAKNASRTVELFTRINLLNSNTTVFNNVALGIGRTDTLTVDDQSTSGLNPDPDANGNPKDNSEPTVVDVGNIILPALFTPIGVAKVASVDTTRNVDGSYRVEFSVVVKNFGTRTLTKVQLSDSLSRVFMDSSEFALIGTPTLSAGSNLRIDSSFNGNQNTNFLIADSSSLVAGASDTLTFIVKVLNKTNAEVGYSNSINGSALDSTTIVADMSQSGLVADANNDNNPGNDSQPTLFRIKGAGVSDSTVAVIIPDAISPNGDNLNDKFVITNIRESDNVSVAIYNRWGQLVYLTDNYKRDFPNENDGWDGVANQGIAVTNSGVPDGTYFYRIISDNANLFNGKPLYNFMTVAR